VLFAFFAFFAVKKTPPLCEGVIMKLKWAFASASVMNLPWDEEFKLWKKYKWKFVELWFDKIKVCMEAGRTCGELGRQMHDAKITPVALGPAAVWTVAENHHPGQERRDLLERMDVAVALGCPSLTICILGRSGGNLALEYKRLPEKLRVAADMAEARRLRLNLEFIGGAAVNGTLGSCIDLVRRADHPALGLALDLCHYYTSASHLEDLALLPKKKLFLVHVSDALPLPMEVLGCEHRTFPGEGRIDVPALLAEIQRRTRYDGFYSVDLYSKPVWEMEPREVFKRIAAGMKFVEKNFGKVGAVMKK
jgi:sugar phosphate isomerase/epimerase